MPAWSTEIANEFILRGVREDYAFDQMQLQKLVYIAHGWCLAITGAPLTGDRPEAWDFGPVYRRLADRLASCGRAPIRELIEVVEPLAAIHVHGGQEKTSNLDTIELQILDRVSLHYGRFSSAELSALTLGAGAPWVSVYREGRGRYCEISHALIRDQFVQFAERLREDENHD